MFIVQNATHADPGSHHETRDEALAAIEELLREGLAEPGECNVVELDQHGDVVGEPFGLSDADAATARGVA
jgi:hypothetical protein